MEEKKKIELEVLNNIINNLKQKYGVRGENPYPSKVEVLVELERKLEELK